jgi:peptidoglycan/xylan/chitin deacetylase (PgdA/CDA1 family)
MVLVHNIGTEKHSNYHTREQILASTQPLGFDGIYKNVYDNQDVLTGKSGIFFVMGNYIGGDNAFDIAHVPKLEQYCTMAQIQEMCTKYDFEIGWHTWSHPDLTKLTESEVMREVTPPTPMRYFAYPYGNFNQMVIDCVKRAGYKKAWSVTQGCTNNYEQDWQYKIYRPYL